MKIKKIYIVLIIIPILIFFISYHNLFKNNNSNYDYKEEYTTNINDEYYLIVNGNATYRTGDIYDLYNMADVVIIGEYLKDIDVSIKYNSTPTTTSSFRILKVIKNNSKLNLTDSIDVKYSGGVVTVKQLLESRDNNFALKLGLDTMSNKDASNLKVKFNIDSELGDKSLTEWKTRLLLLFYNNNTNQFEALQNGYGMLSYDSNNNTAFDIKTREYITYSFLK